MADATIRVYAGAEEAGRVRQRLLDAGLSASDAMVLVANEQSRPDNATSDDQLVALLEEAGLNTKGEEAASWLDHLRSGRALLVARPTADISMRLNDLLQIR